VRTLQYVAIQGDPFTVADMAGFVGGPPGADVVFVQEENKAVTRTTANKNEAIFIFISRLLR
jgi:hypothetical protein